MAMIQCPNCGQQISDKAEKCVHCGMILKQENPKICSECGAILESGATICPNCGCPVENIKEEIPQQVEVTGVKVAKKTRKIAIVAAVFIVAIVISAIGVNRHQKQIEAKRIQLEQEAEKKRIQEYSDNLNAVSIAVLSGASEAEECCNLAKQVWYDTIFEETNANTKKYIYYGTYLRYDDFNITLGNLYADEDFSQKISDIESNREAVEELMKKLKNPPDQYKDAYETLSNLYESYLKFTDLALSPTGNLQTYSSNFTECDSELLKYYNSLKVYLE